MNKDSNFPKKGEIWLLKNPERIREISKIYRPVLIISNNERNEYDNSVVILPITTEDINELFPVEVFLNNSSENGLDKPSKILCDSPFTWNKELRLEKKLGQVNEKIMREIKKAWNLAFEWE